MALGLPLARATAVPSPEAASAYLHVQPSPTLQSRLDRVTADLVRTDPAFGAADSYIAVIHLPTDQPPQLAQLRGSERVYPASVVKFVYLMAAYAWQERGILSIDPSMDRELTDMIHQSSNQATRKVFARLTNTEPGPELAPKEYEAFRYKRMAVKRWLESMGINDLHAVHPTYDGGVDLYGRDQQFLRDRTVTGGLGAKDGKYSNRQAMTATDTVRLLALLATDRALTPADSEAVRQRMHRSLDKQPYLVHRIAGGAASVPGCQAYSKSGTWGPIYADAGLVRHSSGEQFAIAVFTEATPPYRGDAIAKLTERIALELFAPSNEGDK